MLPKDMVNLQSTSPCSTLLAWCSNEDNKISIIDLETKQNYASLDEAKISDQRRFHILKLSVI